MMDPSWYFCILKLVFGIAFAILSHGRNHVAQLCSIRFCWWRHIFRRRHLLQITGWWFVSIKTFRDPSELDNSIAGVHNECIFLIRVIGDLVFACHMIKFKYIRNIAGVESCLYLISHLPFECNLSGSIIGLHRKWVLDHFNISNQIRVHNFGWDFWYCIKDSNILQISKLSTLVVHYIIS